MCLEQAGSKEGRYSLARSVLYSVASREELWKQISSVIKSILDCEIIEDIPLIEQGLDSLGAMELARKLTEITKIDIHAEVIQDNPTLESLIAFIEKRTTLGVYTDSSVDCQESITHARPNYLVSEKETKGRMLWYKYIQVAPGLNIFLLVCVFLLLLGEFFKF
jgi:acyl carrier protein